jgi:signal peptidase II
MRLYHLLIALAVFTLDQITKAIVEANIPLHDVRPVIAGFLHLTHVKNRGAAFGIFAEAPSQGKLMLVVFLSVVALGVVVTLLWRNHPGAKRTGMGLALILGGAIGNLFDRLVHGSVVDFVEFFYNNYHFPAFNVADSAIVIGASLLLLDMMLQQPLPQTQTEQQHSPES